ncbi:MAG TPA: HAD family phosphatase [Chloroflexota bacterium]|jgi:HAD superfamily hydrolase (TIGR01509 family)|nr:HAD family phosphatase [Chloroflexota bacterium]
MARFAAVIFDMDGVLIDSEPLHFAVANEVLGSVGHSLSRKENEEFIGTTTDYFWDELIERRNLPRTRLYWQQRYDDTVLRVLSQSWPAAPGVIDLVRRLQEMKTLLGVASSSKRAWIDATLHSIGLSDAFAACAAGDDVLHGKPAPDIYLLAAERLATEPQDCLAIEDSPNGVLSARRAGMKVLGVRTPYTSHLKLDGARRVVASLAELDLRADPFADW